MPPRHGHGHSNLPIPVSPNVLREVAPGLSVNSPQPIGRTPDPAAARAAALGVPKKLLPRGTPRSPWGAVPINTLDAFIDALPAPGLQQVSLVNEIAWQPTVFANGQTLALNSGYFVPDQMVYVFTDVFFFALTPSGDLAGASEFLPSAALNGLIRFQLLFNGVAPMQLEGNLIVPGTGAQLGRRGGWPFTNRRFGVERSTGWALYATSGQEIQAQAVIDQMPTFPLTVLGVELRGFSLGAAEYERKIVRNWRARLIGQP